MEEEIQRLIDLYRLSDAQFEEYKKKVLVALTTGIKPADEKTLLIVGGQSGAGKSRLIKPALIELERNAVVVDFDELRSMNPNFQVMSENYPEIVYRISHPDTEKVKNAVLDELIAAGYSVIYEGALRNTDGFLRFARQFREADYKIKMDIMAVPKLESYGSTFNRYATAMKDDETPRWVEKSAHDGSYDGVPRTVKAFIDEGLVDSISVFVRGGDTPRKIYSTEGREYPDALRAIEYGREMGRKKAVEDFPKKFEFVKSQFQGRPDLLRELKPWEELYESEKEYFNSLIVASSKLPTDE